jgi:uncharacterized protein YkwD
MKDRTAAEVRYFVTKRFLLFFALISLLSISSAAQMRTVPASYSTRIGETRSRTVSPTKNFSITPEQGFELEKEAFTQLNQKRIENGMPELRWSDDLARLARVHSQDMADNKYFSHRGKDGSMVDNRADTLGIRGWLAIGENIAFMRGFSDPVGVAVEQWMASSAHRRNLLSEQWTETAVGLAVAPDGSFYFTQVFTDKK